MKQKNEEEVLHRMAAYCSTAERSVQDVEKKIKGYDLSYDSCTRIIERLLKEKFIDETRFAKAFVNDKLRFNQWGRIRLNCELQKKKIDSSIRTEVLSGIDESLYLSTLQSLLKTKARTIKSGIPREKYYKLMRYATGRGFETELIHKIIQSLINDNEASGDFD